MLPIDPDRWRELLAHPTWYLRWVESPEYRRLTDPPRGPFDTERAELREAIYALVERLLAEGAVALAPEGPDADVGRKPIRTVVLHHTGSPPGITLERLNVIQLLKLYAPVFARSYPDGAGPAIWSGHLRNGHPVFWGYHWLVRTTGTPQRLLYDSEVAWHSGNRSVNRASVAICLDGNFEREILPPVQVLAATVELIRRYYPDVRTDAVIGHCEVEPDSPRTNGPTLCPGTFFTNGWKRTLHRLLSER